MVASRSPRRSFERSSSAMSMHAMMIRQNVGRLASRTFGSSILVTLSQTGSQTYTANRAELVKDFAKLPVHEIEKQLLL